MLLKRGDLSLQVVVVAAICLLVLIVLTIIFAQRMGWFGQGMRHCDTICVEKADDCKEKGYETPIYLGGCDDGKNSIEKKSYCCR